MPEFQRKGTKNQYDHNQDVLNEVESALAAIEKKEIDIANERLLEGKKLIKKRMKAIKIADREEYGWAVVRHYESDALASDTDDEKDIGRARRAAAAEVKQKREKFRAKYKNRRPAEKWGSGSRGESWKTDRNKSMVCFACGKEGHTQKFCYNRSRNY